MKNSKQLQNLNFTKIKFDRSFLIFFVTQIQQYITKTRTAHATNIIHRCNTIYINAMHFTDYLNPIVGFEFLQIFTNLRVKSYTFLTLHYLDNLMVAFA